MTTNHPAPGPVSLDRLHQISEILSKAAAQSDGGNLGYAMADAVKVIDGAIAAYDAEPVECPKCNDTGMADSGGVQPWGEPILIECDCRDAMLQAGNSPVATDGLIPVSERMPYVGKRLALYGRRVKEDCAHYVDEGYLGSNGFFYFFDWEGGPRIDDCHNDDKATVTHWMYWELPAAPQQEDL